MAQDKVFEYNVDADLEEQDKYGATGEDRKLQKNIPATKPITEEAGTNKKVTITVKEL